MGLNAIKSVGKPVIEEIIQERKERGNFEDLRISSTGCLVMRLISVQ